MPGSPEESDLMGVLLSKIFRRGFPIFSKSRSDLNRHNQLRLGGLRQIDFSVKRGMQNGNI